MGPHFNVFLLGLLGCTLIVTTLATPLSPTAPKAPTNPPSTPTTTTAPKPPAAPATVPTALPATPVTPPTAPRASPAVPTVPGAPPTAPKTPTAPPAVPVKPSAPAAPFLYVPKSEIPEDGEMVIKTILVQGITAKTFNESATMPFDLFAAISTLAANATRSRWAVCYFIAIDTAITTSNKFNTAAPPVVLVLMTGIQSNTTDDVAAAWDAVYNDTPYTLETQNNKFPIIGALDLVIEDSAAIWRIPTVLSLLVVLVATFMAL